MEAAGIEPASEKEILDISTRLVYLNYTNICAQVDQLTQIFVLIIKIQVIRNGL